MNPVDRFHRPPSVQEAGARRVWSSRARRALFCTGRWLRPLAGPGDEFGINVRREPLFFVDVHLHTAAVLEVRDLASGSGWGTVPTPMF